MDNSMRKMRSLQMERLAKVLREHHFDVTILESGDQVLPFFKENIPGGSSIGLGGSVTLARTGVISWLTDNPDYAFIDRYHREDKEKAYKEALTADVFLTGTNAVTMDGLLYNIDCTGNRVAALCYGPDKVYVVAGSNKIVADIEEAKKRLEYDSAPANNIRLNRNNPCTKTGYCVHCDLEGCLCNQFLVTRHSYPAGRIHVILVNEELGY